MTGAIRFYADEHVSRATVNGLRRRGIDVLTVAEAGTLGCSDRAHIARASAESRVIFTHDDDFLRLHAAGAEPAGIVYAHQGTSVGDIVRGLVLVCQVLHADEMRGHVEFL